MARANDAQETRLLSELDLESLLCQRRHTQHWIHEVSHHELHPNLSRPEVQLANTVVSECMSVRSRLIGPSDPNKGGHVVTAWAVAHMVTSAVVGQRLLLGVTFFSPSMTF